MTARAALHVLDWSGCAVAGSDSEAGRAIANGLAEESGGPCTALGAWRGVSPLTAAMLNGALGNVLEMDDVDKRAILHPGPTVIPAALAAAEATGASARTFLEAVVRGYEAVIALGRAVGPGHYAYWHNTGTCGPFGAAAAVGSVYGLSSSQMLDALGLAGTQASGFWQTRHEPRSMAKQLHTARAAHAGVSAAQLARAGMAGPAFILEGPQGFFAATCPDADPEAVLADPGVDWRIEQVSFKPWPACRHAHAAIDAALAARNAGVSVADIASATLTTYSDAIAFCDKPAPATVIEAKFSLQYSIAAALSLGEPRLEHFEPKCFQRDGLRALSARVAIREGDPYAANYPARYGAALSIQLVNGRVLTFDAPDALGDPENPFTDAQIAGKASALLRHAGRSTKEANQLVVATLSLAENGTVADFASALIGAPEMSR